jgi:hypothetical protein
MIVLWNLLKIRGGFDILMITRVIVFRNAPRNNWLSIENSSLRADKLI